MTAEEFSQAESAFQKLPGYRDADAQAVECAHHYRHLARKGHPALVVFCLLLALLLAAGVAYQTNWGKYQFAQLCMTTSHYGKAMDTFAELKGYEDSAYKETDARYQLAAQHLEKGEYEKAAYHFRKLADYQDSQDPVGDRRDPAAERRPGGGTKLPSAPAIGWCWMCRRTERC